MGNMRSPHRHRPVLLHQVDKVPQDSLQKTGQLLQAGQDGDGCDLFPRHLERESDQVCEQYSQACKLKQEGKSLASLKEADTTDQEAEEEDMECEDSEAAGEATHWSQLDTKSMKVADLRTELNARGQPSKGVKLQLAAKLQACLDEEKVKEESKDRAEEEENTSEKNDENETPAEESSNTDGEPKEETAEEVTIVLDERQKEKIASAYKTPSNPCIFVHPNSKAKSGKFDCRVESLSVLLDYRTEDNKE